MPEGMSIETGSMMEPLGVTLQAVMDNRPVADDRVLVIGGGVIGNLIVQSIRALEIPCSITVAEPSRFHGELAAKAGADHIVTDGDIPGATDDEVKAAAHMANADLFIHRLPEGFHQRARLLFLEQETGLSLQHGIL